MNTQEYYQHPNSPLRSEAAMVGHLVQVSEGVEYKEQVWLGLVENHPPSVVTLLSAPFFVYGYSLRDIVELDSTYTVLRKRQPSGRSLLRVFFAEQQRADQVARAVLELGVDHLEWMNDKYLCIDCPNQEILDRTWALLAEHEAAGILEFEAANLAP